MNGGTWRALPPQVYQFNGAITIKPRHLLFNSGSSAWTLRTQLVKCSKCPVKPAANDSCFYSYARYNTNTAKNKSIVYNMCRPCYGSCVLVVEKQLVTNIDVNKYNMIYAVTHDMFDLVVT